MSDPFLDHLPSHERERIMRRLRSPEAYAALRERVKGPEDLERELAVMDRMADMHFKLESEPHLQEPLRKQIQEDIEEQGVDAVLEQSALQLSTNEALARGNFMVKVREHPTTKQDVLVVVTDGKVQEVLPVKAALADRYMTVPVQPPSPS